MPFHCVNTVPCNVPAGFIISHNQVELIKFQNKLAFVKSNHGFFFAGEYFLELPVLYDLWRCLTLETYG